MGIIHTVADSEPFFGFCCAYVGWRAREAHAKRKMKRALRGLPPGHVELPFEVHCLGQPSVQQMMDIIKFVKDHRDELESGEIQSPLTISGVVVEIVPKEDA